MFRNIFVLSMSCLALLGCKANDLEIDLFKYHFCRHFSLRR